MKLADYKRKRKFSQTPEPSTSGKSSSVGPLRFVVQKHEASRLHYDFRLELNGVLKSWAVPKGPSMNPQDKRLAVMVEDHPLSYELFEGIIPKGNYGGGTVMVWDHGVYTSQSSSVDRKTTSKILSEQLKKGHLTFVLLGEKLHGEFALVKTRKDENTWLLIKAGDEYASSKDILKKDRSTKTNRSLTEIAEEAQQKQEIWNSLPKKFHMPTVPKSRMPHAVKPMLADTADTPFNDSRWLFEIKWDGYRAVAEIESGTVTLYSRNKLSYNKRFSPIVQSLEKFQQNAVLDGEVVVLDSQGHADFGRLQSYPDKGGELFYYIFDILYFDGHILTDLPLIHRKEILRNILPSLPHIRFGDYIEEKGKPFFAQAKKIGLEGIMAKRLDSPYRIGERSADWRKIKTGQVTTAVIAGFTKPKGGRKDFGSLVLGTAKRGKFVHIGNVGGGFTQVLINSIYKQLLPLIQDDCPLEVVPNIPEEVIWIKPVIHCDVSYSEWTHDKKMRHPIFLSLTEVSPQTNKVKFREQNEESNQIEIDGQPVTLNNLAKVFWPKEKYTKADVMYYYSQMADILLSYLVNRPQSLLRFPDGVGGESFFQKDTSNLNAKWLSKVTISSDSEKKNVEYVLCQDKASLMYILNLGCIDFNPWNSRVGHLDNPDYLIIDLDPEKASFDKVIEVAKSAREVLEDLDIISFCKTSGKRGLHIYIPMGAVYSYEQVRQFSHLLSLHIQQKMPKLVSLKRDPSQRKGKVYLDYLRNGKGQTAASVYSVRAWPGATVSTPITWNEVTKRLDPSKFTIKTMHKRLDSVGDLFKGVLGKGIAIEKILKKLER